MIVGVRSVVRMAFLNVISYRPIVFVCLLAGLQKKSYRRIWLKFSRRLDFTAYWVQDFVSDPDQHRSNAGFSDSSPLTDRGNRR